MASNIGSDSDITSIRGAESISISYPLPPRAVSPDCAGILKSFQALDTPQGAVRYAALIEYRFRCLTITEDNFDTLLTLTHPSHIQSLCRLLLESQFKGPQQVLSITHLKTMEKSWTGKIRRTWTLQSSGNEFHTRPFYSAYITPEWHVAHELCVVAVSLKAYKKIMQAANSEHLLYRVRVIQPPRELNTYIYSPLRVGELFLLS